MERSEKFKKLKVQEEKDLDSEAEPKNEASNEEFIPRDYQSEILEYAKNENIIAYLGTGTGKTFIAVMLMKHYLHETRLDYCDKGKRTVFLVPTVPLVRQQAGVIRRHLPDAKVGEHIGETTVEFVNKEWWKREIEEKNIFVMVAEEFRLLVHHAFIPLSKINLIVIDECHRAVKNHPYREAMKCFDNCIPHNRPRVLGLTAALVNSKCKPSSLEKNIKALERTLHCTVITVENSEDVKRYGTDPSEYLVVHDEHKCDNLIFVQMKNFLANLLDKFNKDLDDIQNDDLIFYTQPKKCISSILSIINTLGPWCGLHATQIMLEEIGKIERTDDNASTLKMLEDSLKVVYNLSKRICVGSNTSFVFSSPKLKKLLQILCKVNDHCSNANRSENFKGDVSVLCGIIFVKQRLSAYVLHLWLSEISKTDKNFAFLRTNFVVGHGQQQHQNNATPLSKLSSLNHKQQEKVIKDFRAKKYNFLIATSVLEEGIDVRKCNIVIRFDQPDDFRAYVQSKGRARATDAKYILMVSEDEKSKFMESLLDFKEIEIILSSYCRDRQQPTEQEIVEANSCDEILPPYMPVKKDGAPRITMSSSVALIHRYCSTLPCDKSSRLTPKWKTDSNLLGTTCTLFLPVNSAVKEPEASTLMPNKRLAKMAAALFMCEKLHKVGELDENLLPVGNKVDKYISEILGDLTDETEDNNKKKRRCLYEKEVPDILKHNVFRGRICCMLYSIELSFAPNSDLTNLREYEKIEGPHTFGILTTLPLPQLCTFPIFSQKAGLKINVNIDMAYSDVYLDDTQLKNILYFHQYLFSDVIQIGKVRKNARLQFDPECSNFKILIAPIVKDDSSSKYRLDWQLISIVCEHYFSGEEQLKEKNRRLMKPDLYPGALVYPWHYMNSREKIYFHVVNVEQDMTPETPFPDPEYSNYVEYFDKKYDVQIINKTQFLLYVNPISASLTKEKSRYEDQYGKPLMKQTKQAKRRSVRLPPELCIISPVPFSLYRKALSLPVVLYRMCSLLRAEQLRVAVAKDVGIGMQNIGKEFKWIGFEFGEDYLKKSSTTETSSLCFEHNQNMHISRCGKLKTEEQNRIKVGSSFVSKINLDYQVSLVNHPGPSLGMLLTALTLRNANDGINLERLEIVGDSFLKYAISVFLHCKYKDLDEGKLTTLKCHLIRNTYLLHLGKKKQLHRLITAIKYEGRSNWIPPCYVAVSAEQIQKDGNQDFVRYTKQKIPDKSISDCVEALIGAYLLSCGTYGALKFMSWLGMKVFNNCTPSEPCIMLGIYPWLNYTVKQKTCISSKAEFVHYKAFQEKIGYMFNNEIYLLEAFTHATFNPPFHHPYKTDCYQRLEFLGDALLDYIVMRYLYEDPKNHPPGALTDIRAALVNNHFFATLAAKYDYNKYLRYDSASLFQLIDKFVDKATSEEIDVGQCSYDIEEAETDDIAEIDVPKALADVFESVAGAIYIDSGMSLEEVWKVYYPMIKPGLENFCSNVPKPPVRQLFESFPQRIKFHSPKILPSRMVQVKVTVKDAGEFEGVGPNKNVAKRAAAKKALRTLLHSQESEETSDSCNSLSK